MHLVVGVREGNDIEIARRARAVGVAVEPLSEWYLGGARRRGVVVGFTNIVSVEQARRVAERLSEIIEG